MKEDRLLQILDNHIINEGNIGELVSSRLKGLHSRTGLSKG